MMLEQMDVRVSRSLSREAKKLYVSAFPKAERLPWWLLCRMWQVRAWCQEGALRGLTAGMEVPGLYFLAYFAIAPECRGGGYGSQVLRQLREQYGAVGLDVEPLDEACHNYAQRLRRMRFYEKNGLTDTGWDIWEVGGRYWILSTGPVDAAAYKQVFRKASRGLWNVRVEKRK